MNHYQRKRQNRIINALHRSSTARQRSEAAFRQADQISEHIPPGQPILVGHHSEGRHRRALDKIHNAMDKGIAENKKAEYYSDKAASIENNTAISSDDPDAVELLEAKIKELEKNQTLMREANKAVRKNDDARLRELGFSEKVIGELKTPDYLKRVGFPDYALQNNNSNLRRYRQRLEQLKKKAAAVDVETELFGVRILDNVEDNRTQIFFPGKPEKEVRVKLKAQGFRFSFNNNAWQQHLSSGARWWAEKIVTEFYGDNKAND